MAGLTFNGTDLSSYGVSVKAGVDLAIGAGAALNVVTLPGTAKIFMGAGDSQPVELVFPVRIKADTAGSLSTYLDTILSVLSAPTSDAALKLPSYSTTRQWKARWDGGPLRYKVINPACYATEIRFIAQPAMEDV